MGIVPCTKSPVIRGIDRIHSHQRLNIIATSRIRTERSRFSRKQTSGDSPRRLSWRQLFDGIERLREEYSASILCSISDGAKLPLDDCFRIPHAIPYCRVSIFIVFAASCRLMLGYTCCTRRTKAHIHSGVVFREFEIKKSLWRLDAAEGMSRQGRIKEEVSEYARITAVADSQAAWSSD